LCLLRAINVSSVSFGLFNQVQKKTTKQLGMQTSSILLGVLTLLLIALTATYFTLESVRPAMVNALSPKVGPLNRVTRVGNSGDGRDNFLASPGASLSMYLFCTVNSKTPQLGNSQEPIHIFRIGDAIRFQILPGGVSSPPKTQLVIRTQNPDQRGAREEILSIADFPQQKWVQTVLVREGRRYTVYYNGVIVSSQRTRYFPVVESATLMVGDPRLLGEYAFPKIAPTPLRIDEIKQDLYKTSDSRYQPYKPIDWGSLFNLGCPSGVFCFSTKSMPSLDSTKLWKTPYA
jgi:hypothetical protein